MIHNNEIVSIEEVLIKALPRLSSRRPLTRKFIFTNRNTNLKIQICGTSGNVDSCEFNDHQIVVENEDLNSIPRTTWIPHVFGHERILSFEETPQKQLTYQLTKENHLIIEGKGFNSNSPNLPILSPCFFNLVGLYHYFIESLNTNDFIFSRQNSVNDKPSLDGHYLNIRGSHESITVFTNSDSVYSQFICNAPMVVGDFLEGTEFVYSANSSVQPEAAIVATLNFGGKTVTFFLRIDQWAPSHLRVQIQNGSIAFLPHNMNRFEVTYKFAW